MKEGRGEIRKGRENIREDEEKKEKTEAKQNTEEKKKMKKRRRRKKTKDREDEKTKKNTSVLLGLLRLISFEQVKLTSLVKLSVTAMDNLIEIWPDELQAKLREIRVQLCHGFLNILFPSNLIKGMQSLELLEVKQCRSVKVLFDLEGLITREGHPDTLLHSLTNINLRHLPKLTHVWKDNLLGIQGLQNLTSLLIKGCGSLRYIFSVSLAKLLGKLQEIEVIECGVMEAIIDEEPEVGYDVTTNICIFPQLRSLKLCDLPNLRSLCLQASTFEGTLLKIVKVINCPNLKELPSAFQCLQELRRSNVQKEEFFNSAQHHFLDGKIMLKKGLRLKLELLPISNLG